jgi:hypothetical protein
VGEPGNGSRPQSDSNGSQPPSESGTRSQPGNGAGTQGHAAGGQAAGGQATSPGAGAHSLGAHAATGQYGTRSEPLARTGTQTIRPGGGAVTVPGGLVGTQLPVGPATAAQDGRLRVVRGRRTRRVVRRIDVWTVFKMSLLFYVCVFLVFMIAGIILWNIAESFNVITSVEKFIKSLFDLQSFTFRPMVVLQSSALGGAALVLLGTGANVLAALLYNLISDVVGGVQFIVLEETPSPPSE